jgi:hypothetical protein
VPNAMSKQQRLRNAAEGFMAALVECGFRGPVRWSNLDWELPFMHVWDSWPPAARSPREFPKFEVGGYRTSSEPREMLWQLKSTSPFHNGWDQELTDNPRGLTPREYLEIWTQGATPDEWIELAEDFLTLMRDRGRL